MLGVFFALSTSLVDSGFTSALIREKNISETDKNTVFAINLIISVFLYFVLWWAAPLIARFFDQPQLIWLTRVMGLDILFRSLTIVQRAVFINELKFKLLSAIDIGVSILTGSVAIILAYYGLGVWALAIKFFTSSFLVSIAFFWINPWIPSGFVDVSSFKRLFSFGSNLLITGLINTFFNNIYNIIIGKFFSPATLGYYNRAFTFTSQTLSTVLIALEQVSYPILSKTRDSSERMKTAYRKIIITITFVNFLLATLLAFTAEPLIKVLLGDKWLETVPFIQILCISAIVGHLASINQTLYQVIGRSDLFLKVSVISKILAIIGAVIGLNFGIWGLVIGSVIVKYIEVGIVMFISSVQIRYSFSEQLKDIFPVAMITLPLVLLQNVLLGYEYHSDIFRLVIMFVSGCILYIGLALLTRSVALKEIGLLVKSYLKK
jgi:O-antigen/teichoic acid export membrane protein